MIKLIQKHKQYKPNRKDYYIEPRIRFGIDTRDYYMELLPSITFVPWFNRHIGESIICIQWLHMAVGLGIWKRKGGKSDETIN